MESSIVLFFSAVSFILFLIVFGLLFLKQSFYRAIGAMILGFLGSLISFVTALFYFAVDYPGFNDVGELIHNYIYDYHGIGVIFWGLTWVFIVFFFLAVYQLYDKPWSKAKKIEGNPYVYYKG